MVRGLQQAQQPGLRRGRINSRMEAGIDLRERIEGDGEDVIQRPGSGTWDAWGRKRNLGGV